MGIKTWVKGTVRGIARRNEPFRKAVRKVNKTYYTHKFNKGRSNIKIDDKLIYFNSFAGRSYNDSPKAIYEYMLKSEDFKDYIFVWSFEHPEKYRYLEKNRNTEIIEAKSNREIKVLQRAKYWITNYRMLDQYVPTEKQIYVQCWHGTPLKKLGYDLTASDNAMNDIEEIRDKYRQDALRFRYLISPCKFASEKFYSAWNLKEFGRPDTIIEEGYPRNDRLINATQDEIEVLKEKFDIPKDKKIILYAPTWRDNQYNARVGYTYTLNIDFDKLYSALSDKYVILFRAHYLVANSFYFEGFKGFIRDVSAHDDINDLYLISDCLVTDYSSTLFDYANLNRSMYFYMYDLEFYRDSIRGLYMDPDSLPGPILMSEEELINAITSEESFDNEAVDDFNKEYNYLNDGHATERVINRIFG